MKLTPIGDRLVVQVLDNAGEKKAGGIIIPDNAKEKPQIAEVIAVGADEALNKAVKPGDNVIFAKHAGTECEIDGYKYLIMAKRDILAVVEDI